MSDRRGFTVLEAAVASAIVGLTVVGVLGAFGMELRTAVRTRHALEADALAADRLARVRLLTGAELDPLPDSLRQGTFAPPFHTYRWQLATERVHDDTHLFDVTVRIGWDDGSYALATRLYR